MYDSHLTHTPNTFVLLYTRRAHVPLIQQNTLRSTHVCVALSFNIFYLLVKESELACNTFRREIREGTFRRRWSRFHSSKVYVSLSLHSNTWLLMFLSDHIQTILGFEDSNQWRINMLCCRRLGTVEESERDTAISHLRHSVISFWKPCSVYWGNILLWSLLRLIMFRRKYLKKYLTETAV